MARALAQAGASLVLWARDERRLRRTAGSLQPFGVPISTRVVDVTNASAIRRAVRALPRVEILINNAGIWEGDPALKLKPSAWSRVFETDLTSVLLVSQAIVPSMVRAGYGKVINIASTSAFRAYPEGAAYCSAKAGLVQLTRVLAVEWGPLGVRVNAIAPGTFRTDMTADVFRDRAWVAKRARRIPLGRFGEPDDLAGLAVFLSSSDSDYITGHTFIIDGGASL